MKNEELLRTLGWSEQLILEMKKGAFDLNALAVKHDQVSMRDMAMETVTLTTNRVVFHSENT